MQVFGTAVAACHVAWNLAADPSLKAGHGVRGLERVVRVPAAAAGGGGVVARRGELAEHARAAPRGRG